MNKRRLLIRLIPVAIAAAVILFQFSSSEKFTNEAGRTARHALNPRQEEALGLQSYQLILGESAVEMTGPEYDMVVRVAQRLAAATGSAATSLNWHVSLVRNSQVNAFCLPGGKIVVYTGLLPVAETEAGLATVMGHEMAHATLRHGSERLLQETATQTFLSGFQASFSDMTLAQQHALMGAIGAGARYGVLLPFSRGHESEADKIGLLYMARAGYDPAEAVEFWQRMSQASAGDGKPPEFMSTHPADSTRIEQLKKLLPQAQAEYKRARPQ